MRVFAFGVVIRYLSGGCARSRDTTTQKTATNKILGAAFVAILDQALANIGTDANPTAKIVCETEEKSALDDASRGPPGPAGASGTHQSSLSVSAPAQTDCRGW